MRENEIGENSMSAGGPPSGIGGPPQGTGKTAAGMGGPPRGAGGPPNGMGGNPLGYAPVRSLMMKFAIPSIVGMLVSALYNMVDQLFIGKAVGTLGNTATSIAFPFTTGCMALALLFGIGGASCFNLTLGMGDKKRAPYFAGNALSMLVISGVIISAITLTFLTPLLKRFGATDAVMPYAKEYVKYTAFLMYAGPWTALCWSCSLVLFYIKPTASSFLTGHSMIRFIPIIRNVSSTGLWPHTQNASIR